MVVEFVCTVEFHLVISLDEKMAYQSVFLLVFQSDVEDLA